MTARQIRRVTPVATGPALAIGLPPIDDRTPHWTDRALCAQVDPEIFFPEKGQSTIPAKRVCVGCEVRTDCLEDALLKDERYGVRGGKSERERRKINRDRRRAVTVTEVAS
jgi:WhiB family redox-sensing transcriptional regulator